MLRIRYKLDTAERWNEIWDDDEQVLICPTETGARVGDSARVELAIKLSGPRVLLRGRVVEISGSSMRVRLNPLEFAKTDYIKGFVRGGMLNLRKLRRLPLRIDCTFFLKEPFRSYTRDINEQGLFVVAESPLPEGTVLDFEVDFPRGKVMCRGIVKHTVIIEDEDVPGMGIIFSNNDMTELTKAIEALENDFLADNLPDEYLL